jgi:lipoprotein NlpI
VIKLDPKDGAVYFLRGCARYDARKWKDALADYRKAAGIKSPYQDEARLRVWLVRARLGEYDEANRELKDFVESRNSGESDDWFEKLAQFLYGGIAEEHLLSAAKAKDPTTARKRKCQANFYAGSRRVAFAKKARVEPEAKELLEACLKTDLQWHVDYRSAKARLAASEKDE